MQHRRTVSSRPRVGRAAVLVKQMCAQGVDREFIAREIHLAPETLDAYVSGARPMPLNVQARLALFMIARVPGFVREGNQLRGQVAAAIAFQTRSSPAEQLAPRA